MCTSDASYSTLNHASSHNIQSMTISNPYKVFFMDYVKNVSAGLTTIGLDCCFLVDIFSTNAAVFAALCCSA